MSALDRLREPGAVLVEGDGYSLAVVMRYIGNPMRGDASCIRTAILPREEVAEMLQRGEIVLVENDGRLRRYRAQEKG